MKINILSLSILLSLLISSCFKDEGNYDYLETKAPVFDMGNNPQIIGYSEAMMECEAKFHFPQADSVQLMNNSEVLWMVDTIVLQTGKKFSMPTDTVLKRLNYKAEYYSINGTMFVRNKQTGVGYICKILYDMRPKFAAGGWAILSEYNGGSKLSYQRVIEYYDEENKKITEYENYDNIFEQSNPGITLKGKPLKLQDHKASYINFHLGGTALFTDKEAYDISNIDFSIYRDFKNEFTSEIDANTIFIDSYFNGKDSYLVDNKGNLYYRKFTSNYLGGKFLAEPYYIDNKSYNIKSLFQYNFSAKIKYMYDELNKRFVKIWDGKGVNPVKLNEGAYYPIDLGNMGDDIEMLAIGNGQKFKVGNAYAKVTTALYKKNGQLRLLEFTSDEYVTGAVKSVDFADYEINVQIQEDSKIWFPSFSYPSNQDYKYCFFYTKDNELRYFNKKTDQDLLMFSAATKITAAKFFGTWIYGKIYNYMGIGLQNGDFYLVDLSNPDSPTIIEDTKFNVGGKIVDISNIGSGNVY